MQIIFRAAVSVLVIHGAALAAPGAQIYSSRCAMCHQPAAVGLSGQFPRLAGRTAALAASPEGRHYLASAVLNGLYGPIVVDGKPITGMMPAMGTMADADVAEVLNYLAQLKPGGKKAKPFDAAEIAAVRAEGRVSGARVAAERARLVEAKLIP